VCGVYTALAAQTEYGR